MTRAFFALVGLMVGFTSGMIFLIFLQCNIVLKTARAPLFGAPIDNLRWRSANLAPTNWIVGLGLADR